MRILDSQKIDKQSITIINLHDDDPDDPWGKNPPLERLEGLEILRQMWSNYDPDTERLPKFYSVIERTRR